VRRAPGKTEGLRLPSFFRNPQTGEVVIVQRPNVPLKVAFGALAWWAVLEVKDGESPFRRALGGVVLAGAIVGASR